MLVEIKPFQKNNRKDIKMNNVKKEIIDGNFLIAVFMGGMEVDWFNERVVLVPYEHHAHLGLPQTISKENYLTWARECTKNDLKYHYDWSHIMPVYLKAKEVIKSKMIKFKHIHTGRLAVRDAGELILEGKCLEASEKLVEAIKWYNKTKDKK